MTAVKFALALMLVVLLGTAADSRTAAVPDGWLTTVHGVAVTKSGRPVSDLLLYLDERPGNDGYTSRTAATVVTDAFGRFTLNYDPKHSVPLGSLLSCLALPIDVHAWSLSYRTAHQSYEAASLFEQETLDCERHWTGDGEEAVFTVVVPDLGFVSLLVRGPDGNVIRNDDVELITDARQSQFNGVMTYSGRTDATGHLLFRYASGLMQLHVVVPGVGFGSVGTINVLANQTITPPLPPLAPFAEISGRIAPSLAQTGAVIAIDQGYPNYVWHASRAIVASDGTFDLTDVLPGTWTPVVRGTRGTAKEKVVTVAPGQSSTNVFLEAKEIPKPGPPQLFYPDPLKPVRSVHGRVIDTEGNPVADAMVSAIYSRPDYHGFATQTVFTAMTDADGRYAIQDPNPAATMPESVSPEVLIDKAGAAPVLIRTWGDPDTAHPPLGTDVTADAVLSFQAARLTVRVLDGAEPAAGVTVELTNQSNNLVRSGTWTAPGSEQARTAAFRLLFPTATTGSDGTAVFDNLAPGFWEISIAKGNAGLFVENWNCPSGSTYHLLNFRKSVAVRANRSQTYSLQLAPWSRDFPFRSFRPDGTLITGDGLEYQSGPAGDDYDDGTSARPDDAGIARVTITDPGLVRVTARFHDNPTKGFSHDVPPFDEAMTVIAASPALDETRPIAMHTVTRRPGSIRVKLLDRQGRPLSGAVIVERDLFSHEIEAAGTDDALGEVVFANLPSGSYALVANVFGAAPLPDLGTVFEPLPVTAPVPSAAALTGHSIALPQAVTVQADTQTRAVLRPQPVAYLYGRIQVRPGETLSDLWVRGFSERDLQPHFDRLEAMTHVSDTGAYVSGPFLQGPAHIDAYQNGGSETAGATAVTLSGGKAARVDLIIKPSDPAKAERAQLKKTAPLSGVIFLPGGKTPAWGARAKVFEPDEYRARRSAGTDALGNLSYDGGYDDQETPHVLPPGSPTVPVVVAYLPGSYGTVVAPYTPGEPVRLVLPPAVSLRGRVTVRGHSVAGLRSTFTIQAAYQGRGKLNDLLSIETTAQADGSFELAGLTPGVYQIQAARDGIWLSQTQTVTVADKDLPDATLDIGVPGAVIVFHVRDDSGKPLISRMVTLARPAGPLTELLWPKSLATDGAGDVRIEGLEAGMQSIFIDPSRSSRRGKYDAPRLRSLTSFVVPPYANGEQAVEKTVIVTRQ